MRQISFAAAAFAAVFVSGAAEAQGNKFDGNWSVEVITEKGECDKAYRWPVIVQNGRARYGGPENFNVSGQIAPNGAVSGVISRGQDRANVRGRLSGGWGQGTWTAAGGSRTCSGRWNAEKRG
ncbi:MAG TPA: hypothetical protein VF601_05720 [Beijerinckiaceae bacterium]|jgi:hypothetical protein